VTGREEGTSVPSMRCRRIPRRASRRRRKPGGAEIVLQGIHSLEVHLDGARDLDERITRTENQEESRSNECRSPRGMTESYPFDGSVNHEGIFEAEERTTFEDLHEP
jgi:hypothetical protein